MANVQKLPVVNDEFEESYLRRNYKGRYLYAGPDPLTGEIPKEPVERNTRREYPDPIPVEIPVALRRPESTDDKIRRLMNETRAWEAWCERQDESDLDEGDFDNEDLDPDLPPSPFEFTDHAMQAIRRRERIEQRKKQRADASRDNDPLRESVDQPAPPLPEGGEKRPKAGETPPSDPPKADSKAKE